MDINCTEKCVYQTEGKCGLNKVPDTYLQSSKESETTDCPYIATSVKSSSFN